ncbi:MAG TPA: hypothetical protein VFQ68_39005 [Streptosporangiaceae bacterium]|nr:hypothetical protein [Streptosporangiaceae bacterium]
MTGICFIDTETTGLDPDRHAIWEVALITPDGDEHVWQFPVDEMSADPFALNIGRYWDRHWGTDNEVPVVSAIYDAHNAKSRRKNFPDEGRAVRPGTSWARRFRDLTAGCHLAGAVISFDEERLRRLLHSLGVLHRWHYHLVDVEALAAGYLAAGSRHPAQSLTPPWKSDALSAALGVEIREEDRHTALGDARWAKAIYGAVMGQAGS